MDLFVIMTSVPKSPERLERFAQINIRNVMADIVVCGDLEGEIEESGELSKLAALGSIAIFNDLDPPREVLVPRLRGATISPTPSRQAGWPAPQWTCAILCRS